MRGKPELKTTDVEKGLKALGFIARAQKATSHVQWVFENKEKGIFYKVTLDPHHSPFSDDLIASMANQAGVTKAQFYEICTKDGVKKAKKGRLSWLSKLFPADS